MSALEGGITWSKPTPTAFAKQHVMICCSQVTIVMVTRQTFALRHTSRETAEVL